MRETRLLTIASLISILLLAGHVTDDIVMGIENGKLWNLTTVPILVLWLCAALLLAERRSGYVITLLLSLLGCLVPVIHFSGPNGVVGHRVAAFAGARSFVFSLLAIGVTSLFSVVLTVRGLWSLRRKPVS